jgi:Tfp pilus assembly protein PilO
LNPEALKAGLRRLRWRELYNCFKDKDADIILFEYQELLCQITERFKNQGKTLPSNKEMVRLFKIAIKNYPEAFSLNCIK